MSDQVFIIDTITPVPGQTKAVLDAYLVSYVPAAKERGMTLHHQWISPPIALEPPRTNTLNFIWSVEGTSGWWHQRFTSNYDPAIAEFWAALAPLIRERSRTFHEEAANHV